ncbi:hypothetical protein ABZ807_18625 [Micromonospora sp. NPDC047548]|uniref:hypothetical protein n=1 Tax=Micromonospora sp. NPDC047548 TaxID=3155624 RepID=UPI0033D6A870
MSRWKMLETWDRDLLGLADEQLVDRLSLAREYEQSSSRLPGRNPKARRDWRRRREAVEAEMQSRGLP